MLSLGKMAYFVALLPALLKEMFFWKLSEMLFLFILCLLYCLITSLIFFFLKKKRKLFMNLSLCDFIFFVMTVPNNRLNF